MTGEPAKRVVIVGGGFGGLYAATYLAAADIPERAVDITLISRNNYFTFTPLLAEVVAGVLGREDVTVSYRMLAQRYGFRFTQASMTGLDIDRGVVETDSGEEPFDYLVLALGASPQYFGNDQLAATTMPFASVNDALAIRNRVIRIAERASQERDPDVRRRMLTFAIAGAGPAGVEVASEIWHMLSRMLPRYYAVQDRPRVTIINGGDRILAAWDADLVRHGQAALEQRGITVYHHTHVTDYADGVVSATGPDGALSISADTVIWTAGTEPATHPLQGTPLVHDATGPIQVDEYLRAGKSEHVFAVGDVALRVETRTGERYPAVAPIALS